MKIQRPVSLVDPHHQEDTALHRSGYVLCSTSVRSSVCLRIAHVHQQRPIVEGAVERWGGQSQKHINPSRNVYLCMQAVYMTSYSIAYNVTHTIIR